ncbi:MAG TPA: hypothetical protein VGE06_13435, partial [Flavisolibacter sp.]
GNPIENSQFVCFFDLSKVCCVDKKFHNELAPYGRFCITPVEVMRDQLAESFLRTMIRGTTG